MWWSKKFFNSVLHWKCIFFFPGLSLLLVLLHLSYYDLCPFPRRRDEAISIRRGEIIWREQGNSYFIGTVVALLCSEVEKCLESAICFREYFFMFFRLFHSQPGNGPRVSLPIFSLTKKNSFLVELNITTSLCPKHLVLSSLLINGILFASPTTFRGDVRQVHECSFTHSPKGNIPTFKRSKHFDKCS